MRTNLKYGGGVMYRYLDRPVWDVPEPHRFLLAAMRLWVQQARAGRCPCRALADGFAARGIAPALRDFAMAMATLDGDATSTIRFADRGCPVVRDDEARLLALYDAALAGLPDRVRRIAATFVADDAAGRLATAVEWVALHLSDGTFVERDQ